MVIDGIGYIKSTTVRPPSNNPITLVFGSADPPYSVTNRHNGLDFSYLPDNKIYAPFSGKVIQVPMNGNDGNGSYMTDAKGRFHGMLHASSYLVPNKSMVEEGQPIAVMGATGVAQGVHCHWAVKENGQFIDPMSVIDKEEEPMFNKGDASNFSKAYYGTENPPQFVLDQVGNDWKTAMYNLMAEGNLEYAIKLNQGDVVNVQNATGIAIPEGITWKQAYEQYIVKNLPSSDAQTKLNQVKEIING